MDSDRHAEGAVGVAPAFAAPLAAIAAITYVFFLLEHFLGSDLDVVNGYVSELSAADQPFNAVYSTGDAITGVLSITVAVTALLTMPRRPWATAGWVFLGLFGASAIGDSVFPLECAPSLETWCALRERAGQVSFSHQFHAVTSSSTVTCGILALLFLSVAARRYGWWPALARWGPPLAAAEATSVLATMTLMVTGRWLGLAQRVQIGILCASLLLIAWALYAQRRAHQVPRP